MNICAKVVKGFYPRQAKVGNRHCGEKLSSFNEREEHICTLAI
jgi:hypothetical protein